MRDVRTQDLGRLLRFLSPGVLHGMSNALFAVVSHAKLLGGGEGEIARVRAAILRAAGVGEGTLEVVRFALGDTQERPAPRQVGVLLRQVCDVLRVSCHEHGLRLKASHSSVDSPATVDGVQLCRALVETVRELAEGLPAGYGGILDIDVLAQGRDGVTLMLSVASDRDLLPFPIDLLRVTAAARRAIADEDVLLERSSLRQLSLRMPALREPGPREAVLLAME